MLRIIAFILVSWLALSSSRAAEPVVITFDGGGSVQKYSARWIVYSRQKTPVILKGGCVSACARFMSLPAVCALPGAYFLLHGITDERGTVHPAQSRADSVLWETPTSVALQDKYNAYGFGIDQTPPPRVLTLEPGVSLHFIRFTEKGVTYYQKFLRVDALRLVKPCQPQRSLNSNASTEQAKKKTPNE